MTHWRALTSVSLAAALAACSSGDITLAPTNVDNSTGGGGDTGTGGTTLEPDYGVPTTTSG